jgi:hypothetical protein
MTREVDVLIVTALKLEFEQFLKVEDGPEDDGWSGRARRGDRGPGAVPPRRPGRAK